MLNSPAIRERAPLNDEIVSYMILQKSDKELFGGLYIPSTMTLPILGECAETKKIKGIKNQARPS